MMPFWGTRSCNTRKLWNPPRKRLDFALMFARLILNHFGAQEMTLKRRDGGTGVDVYIDGEKALNGKIWQVNTEKVGHA